jgi:hypothetical protein
MMRAMMTGPDESRTPDPERDDVVPEETFPADTTFDSALLGADLWDIRTDVDETEEVEDESGLVMEDLRLQVRDTILEAVRSAGIKAVFAEGRRTSDISLVLLKGERLKVLAFAPRLVEDFTLDLEVMRSAEVNGVYELMLAVTDVLEGQNVQQPERRQKLKRFLDEIEG